MKDVISTILSLLFIFASIIFGFTAIFAICLLLTRDWVDALIIFTLLIIYKILLNKGVNGMSDFKIITSELISKGIEFEIEDDTLIVGDCSVINYSDVYF